MYVVYVQIYNKLQQKSMIGAWLAYILYLREIDLPKALNLPHSVYVY